MATVLIVEDEPAVRELLSLVIATAGFTVFTAKDGVEALWKIQQQKPDIVVSDLHMPRMNGFELMQALHHEFPPEEEIATSGSFDSDFHPEGLIADEYVIKDPKVILCAVEKLCALEKLTSRPQRPILPPTL